QDPAPEEVVDPAPGVHPAEAGALGVLSGQPQPSRQLVPVIGRPADPPLPHLVAVEPAVAQVLAGRSGIGGGQEPLVVPVLGGSDDLGEALALGAGLALPGLVVVEADADLGREALDRLGEAEVLLLA